MELVRFEPFAGFRQLSVCSPRYSRRTPLVDATERIEVVSGGDVWKARIRTQSAQLPGMKREDIKVEVKDEGSWSPVKKAPRAG